MFPKSLFYGSRAATHIHLGANNSFRNVLQLQTVPLGPSAPSSGSILSLPGAASSSWGTGGSQYSAYQGYTGVGRAITQANSSSTGDGSRDQLDDSEDRPISQLNLRHRFGRSTRLFPPRSRSRSISLILDRPYRPNDISFPLSQNQHRLQHTIISSSSRVDSSLGTAEASIHGGHSHWHDSSVASTAEPPPSLGTMPIQFTHEPPEASSERFSRRNHSDKPKDPNHAIETSIEAALQARDYPQLLSLVDKHGLRHEAPNNSDAPSASVFNQVLIALAKARPPGEPLATLLQVYNAALSRNVVPGIKTYHVLIEALVDRDAEIQGALSRIEVSLRYHSLGLGWDGQDLVSLRELYLTERAYESAVALLDAVELFQDGAIPAWTISRLIKCSALRGDVETARRLFPAIDKHAATPDTRLYAAMIDVYKRAGDLTGAEKVYQGFLNQLGATVKSAQRDTRVQDRMIQAYIELGQPEKGLELLGYLMDHGSLDAHPPLPTQHTFCRIIEAFSAIGDADSALKWYNRLAQQKPDPFMKSLSIRVTPDMWFSLFKVLSLNRSSEDVNALIRDLLRNMPFTEKVILNHDYCNLWLGLNLRYLQTASSEARRPTLERLAEYLPYIIEHHFNGMLCGDTPHLITKLADIAVDDGLLMEAILLIRPVVMTKAQAVAKVSAHETHDTFTMQRWTRDFFTKLLSAAATDVDPAVAFRVALESGHLVRQIGGGNYGAGDLVIDLYSRAMPDPTKFSPQNWEYIANTFCDVELRRFEDASSQPLNFQRLVADMSIVAQENLSLVNIQRLVETLRTTRGWDTAHGVLSPLGEFGLSHLGTLNPASSPAVCDPAIEAPQCYPIPMASTAPQVARIDAAHSRFVDEHYSNPFVKSAVATPLQCFDRFEQGAAIGIYPYPTVLGHLINALGRMGEVDKVQRIYAAAQVILQTLEYEPNTQTSGWFIIEDQMIAALAHSGNMEAANVHRLRILQHGGAPSADSYGALIAAVKDTSDDSSMAQVLFEESMQLGVTPNIYLYNTMISKLAKARKTDYALELFYQMPHVGIRPTAVTFAAVIGACCRVGDEESAVYLFEQMIKQPRYQPRVPVYNSMIQFFVHHKKDKTNALHYHRMLLDAGLEPTAHTYKLLLDVHGSIEPVDVAQVELIFAEMRSKIVPQGTHWASIIGVYGTGLRDLDRALSLFDSIGRSECRIDAVIYESLFNALFLNNRLDLVPKYRQRMEEDGVHMTAYVANVLIRGYAQAGQIQRARDIFESLADSPVGVAAPHNHSPVRNSLERVPLDAPVYREPSSWESMIIMEIEFGEPSYAELLMDRFAARMFPPAVTNRVRSILMDYRARDR